MLHWFSLVQRVSIKFSPVQMFSSANFLECKYMASKPETGSKSTTTQMTTPFQVAQIFSRGIFLQICARKSLLFSDKEYGLVNISSSVFFICIFFANFCSGSSEIFHWLVMIKVNFYDTKNMFWFKLLSMTITNTQGNIGVCLFDMNMEWASKASSTEPFPNKYFCSFQKSSLYTLSVHCCPR